MAYQPRRWTHRELPQKQPSRRGKTRSKSKRGKGLLSRSYISEEHQVSTSEEVVKRTLNRLNVLGSQRFALPPFSDHFDRWLMNVGNVLSEFESNLAIKVDDQFVKERSQVLSDVKLKLEEGRLKEVSIEKTVRNLSDAKRLLEQIESKYAAKSDELESRKDHEVERLSSKVEVIREELAQIAQMKTGFLRGTSKKTKAQKEWEATGKLTSAENELAKAIKTFTIEQEKLRDEYTRRKQPIVEQIRNHEKEIGDLDAESQADGSIEARRSACEGLVNAMNALLRRSTPVTGN
jgi:DNA mismatch repair ATPase MutS